MDYEITTVETIQKKYLVKECKSAEEATEVLLSGEYDADLGVVKSMGLEIVESLENEEPELDTSRREELIESYANRSVEDMDLDALCEFAQNLLEERLNNLSDEALLEEIEQFQPELLED